MSKVTKIEVFYAGDMDVRGMVSTRDAGARRPGEYGVFQNVRVRFGAIKVRGGIENKGATGLTGSTLAGAAKVIVNGTKYQLVALDNGSGVRCFYSTGTVFTEFTSGSGVGVKYPNTRFATGSWIDFTVVRDQTSSTVDPFTEGTSGRDYIVASSGVASCCFDLVTGDCAPIVQAWDCGFGKVRQFASYPYYYDLAASNLSAGATTGTGTITDNAQHSVTGGRTPTWTFAAVNDAAVCTVTSGATVCKGKQVPILFDCPDDPTVIFSLKIELYDATSATYRTLWNGSDTTNEDLTLVPGEKGFQLALFPRDPNAFPDHTYTDIKITYVGSANPASAIAFYLLGVYGSGNTPGRSLFGGSYFFSGSRTESRFIVADDKGGVNIRKLGCQDSRNYVPLPHTALSYYSYAVTYQHPNATYVALGLDKFLLYRRQIVPDQVSGKVNKTFYHCASDTLCTFSGGVWSDGAKSDYQDVTVNVDTDVLTLRPAPDAYNTCMPPGLTLCSAAGRLLVGSARAAGSNAHPADAWVSEQDLPFRFRDVLRVQDGVPDPVSGTKVSIFGEKIQRLLSTSSSLLGAEPILMLTDQSVFSLDGSDSIQLSRARRAFPHGTLSPWSAALYNNNVIFLDSQKRLVMLGPDGFRFLSAGRVEDVLFAIPDSRIRNVYGLVFRDRYYMSYTIGGGSANTAWLVYDFVTDSFSRDVTLDSINPGVMFEWGDELRFWDESGTLLEHDRPGKAADTSNAIKWYIEGRLVRNPEIHKGCSFDRLGIECQGDPGSTVAMYWTGRPSGQTQFYNDGYASLSPKTVTQVTPASTDTGADTVTFTIAPRLGTGQTVTPATTASGLTAGTTYYLAQVTSSVFTFHTSLSDALTGSSKVNLSGSVGVLNVIDSAVLRWSGDSSDHRPTGIQDAGAYPTWTGTATGGTEIRALWGEFSIGGEIADV